MTEIINPKIVEQKFAPEITYTEAVYNHPSPLMVKITPVGGTSNPQLSVSSVGTLSEFQIPSKIINLSKSYLSLDLLFPAAAAGLSTIISGNLGAIIDRITVSSIGSNTILCDISNVGAYLEATDAHQTNFTEFIKNTTQPTPPFFVVIPASPGDTPAAVVASVNTQYNQSPLLPTTLGVAQRSPYMDIGKANTITNPIGSSWTGIGSENDNGAITTGPRNTYIGTAASPTAISVKLPMSMFHSTILGVNKNLYFSGETLNIAIYWSAVQSYAWSATIGTVFPAISTGTAVPTLPLVSNLAFYACVEQNAFLTSKLVNQVNTEGLTMPIPLVWSSKQNLSASNQSITLNITKSHGNSLCWVAWAPFKNPETLNTCKAHTTFNLEQYQTLLNQIPILTNTPINVVTGEHYMYNRANLDESCIQSLISYNNHFTHFDNFVGFSLPKFNDNLTLANGIDLTKETQQYQLNSQFSTADPINNYIFWCAQKQLVLTRNGVMLI
jgi:hypothetical protein